ncbi:putative bifunctional inhibitor/plant lipid transfer protein/seed storage helical [Helianthus debilis subsp. tardiflorus]
MALKTTAFLLTINLLFFSLVSSDTTPAAPAAAPTCSADILKFGVCTGLLNNLGGVVVGSPPTLPCCNLFLNLVSLEAATCVCNAIKANVLGVNIDASFGLSMVFNNCGQKVPTGFEC